MKKNETAEKISHVVSIVMLALCIVWGIEVVACSMMLKKANNQLERASETLSMAQDAVKVAREYRDEALKLHTGTAEYVGIVSPDELEGWIRYMEAL